MDFAYYLEIEIDAPPVIETKTQMAAEVRVENHGSQPVNAQLVLLADGVMVDPVSFDLEAQCGDTAIFPFQIAPGIKTIPFCLVAQV